MDTEDTGDIFGDQDAIMNEDKGTEEGNEQTVDDGAESSQTANAALRKRIIRNPRPKLNAERLCGERGIPALEKHFQNVQFKGKRHEKEDLDRLLASLEHWAHRLFPSLKFSESLTHIEKLGKKKVVQVCVSKLRLDMPILGEEFITEADDELGDVQSQLEMEFSEPQESTFDQLMREHREAFPEISDTVEHDIVASSSQVTIQDDPPSSPLRPTVEEKELTEEQKQRIEQNRKLAAERRKMKFAVTSSSLTSDTRHSISTSPKDISTNLHLDVE